ncbi:FAD-binding oxidoreductase [Massilia sp. PAMC28688]|uniref:FAD-binding oxidoreductase n=1 Tax=Massilia sp. PAMC28688 TaxID=2861283 RepID=UPI001C6340F3|nr:FAD-binding oxidoreductase [Massilia sp. PAMC28688]QYF92466.1 FAD-binding oxidoreductase [Massilia sp. PAMC28688]
MRRWNGWGDDGIDFALNDEALAFLQQRIGSGITSSDATHAQACAQLKHTRLPWHPLVSVAPSVRLASALGQSLPDWLRMRHGRIDTAPDGVAFPESADQVCELLAYARANGALVIPCGGATSVAGHLTVPQGQAPVLSINMTRMRAMLNLDVQAQLATFEAGVLGPDLEAQLRAHGFTLGHFPQSFEYSTLGGWVVTRSSGQQSLRYGRIEQLFAGGRVETPSGRLELPTFPASAAGIDLREMVLGSEGRLGILTEATVRISPLPEQEAFHAVFFPNWEAAVQATRAIAQARLPLSMLRLSNAVETVTMLTLAGHKRLIGMLEGWLRLRGCGEGKCMLMVGASGSKAAVRAAIAGALALARAQRGIHVGRKMGEKWKQNRFRNVYLRNTAWEHGYAIDTVETAVDWPGVTAMMHAVEDAATQAMAARGERLHVYTHLSHLYAQGASVYTTFVYRLSGSFDGDLARWRALKGAVSEAIVANGGTISHQHGVGSDHAPYLEAEKGALGMGAMDALFRHFDAEQRMNPGKLVAA